MTISRSNVFPLLAAILAFAAVAHPTLAFAPLAASTVGTGSTRVLPSTSSARSKSSSSSSSSLSAVEPQQSNLPEIPFVTKTLPSDRSNDLMIGEDAGTFDIQKEEWGKLGESGWFTFSVAVGTIMTAVIVLWVYHPTGYSDDLLAFLENLAGGNPHIVTLLFGILFPIVHSGLASLRPLGEQVVGARIWRVIFAFPSLCLSYSWITYFISHAHEGIEFYDLSHNTVAHTIAWTVNFLSFFFLYPSVFNLKEVAAIEKPTLHLWETGMIRITRHPQFVGQSMWSAAHLAMVGTSFTALTMALLVGHHAFACWNGDRRYYDEHGEAFLQVKERTSILPFQAVWEGRQVLPPDYYKELLRGPYFVIAIGTLGAYFAHPYMQAGSALARNTGLVPGGILDGIFS
jgi:zeta-carotene isomerase